MNIKIDKIIIYTSSDGYTITSFAVAKIQTDHFTANVTTAQHFNETMDEAKNKVINDLYALTIEDYDSFDRQNAKRVAIQAAIANATYKHIDIDAFWNRYNKLTQMN